MIMTKEQLYEMDSMFRTAFKYYQLKDRKALIKQWNGLLNEVKSTLAPVSKSVLCKSSTDCALGYNCKRTKETCDEFE
jgi:hypothetical protein